MGRHSRDDDPAPRLPERPQDPRRPQNRLGPPTPLRYGPRSQAAVLPAQPFATSMPAGADDHTRVLPAAGSPDNRTTTGLRRPPNGFQPEDDPANAHRITAGLRRPDPVTGTGGYRAVSDERPAVEGRSTAAGAYPVVGDEGITASGGFSTFTDGVEDDEDPSTPPGGHGTIGAGRATSTGGFRPVCDDFTGTGGHRPVGEGRATSSGGFRATATGTHASLGENRATSSGSFRATSTGTHPPVDDRRATSTGSFRATSTGTHTPVGESRATSTGGFRIKESRATATGSHQPVGEGRSTSSGGFRTSESRATSTGSHRPVGKSTSTGGFRAADEGRATSTGSHHAVTDGRSTATGTHRAMGKIAGRRRIAKWPIVAGAFVVLLVVGLLAWGWANNVLNSRAEAQANACTDGNSTMTVVVTPTAQQPVSAAAARWNQANTVVHAHCVHIDVRAIPSQQVLDALTGKADLSTIGGLPVAWLPENSYWVDQLTTTKPGMVGSPAESVASARSADYPFLGLAGNTVDDVQARAAQVFRDYLREPAQQADFTAAGLTGG
ncbi:hypothetical protein LWP59_14950 [Amycolatopsis acidiphila]|uniref:hypothetical protein n=1 Tax=Amycolatopsis acidiphila TaxID=715473 RepID=UPI0019C3A065|nr:hypothetical protein [Amycolatopsis acidiphila]UIJ62826.1 hypothetical protein LWP59_14950 [Amycolatopsis acidiphila]GHG64459.1 hypothetical protein GCM10017788_21160 [Amycolatopsis acidiphila]